MTRRADAADAFGDDAPISAVTRAARFVDSPGPNPLDATDPGPHPYHGASFLVRGTIYPGGTFAAQGAGRSPMPDGRPEFPGRVIGSSICRGWFVGDSDGDGATTPDDDALGGIFTPGGRFVATTQIYDLDLGRTGASTLIRGGIERIELDQPFTRPIAGGSGRFRYSCGHVTQTAIAPNASTLFGFEFDFDVRPRTLLC